MTEIETTINEAIEGGWSDIHDKCILHKENKEIEFCIYFKEEELDYHGEPTKVGQHKGSIRVSLGIALLDPKFWEAVGKTRGWEGFHECSVCGNGVGRDSDENFQEKWRNKLHAFIDHLADGLTIEEALTKLR